MAALLAATNDCVGSILPKLLKYHLHRSTGGSKRGALYDDDYKRICKEYVLPMHVGQGFCVQCASECLGPIEPWTIRGSR